MARGGIYRQRGKERRFVTAWQSLKGRYMHRSSFEIRTWKIGLAAAALLGMFVLGETTSFRANGLSSSQGRQEQRYEFTGIVKSVDKPKRRATIKHDKVEGLMDGMTMPFLIKDDKALGQLQPGDQIKATLVSTDDGTQWLEKVVIVAKAQSQNRAAESNPEPNFDDKPFWLMGSSGNDRNPPPSRFDGDAAGFYTCSMHLNYRASNPGECPRFRMTLISTEPATQRGGPTLAFDALFPAPGNSPTPSGRSFCMVARFLSSRSMCRSNTFVELKLYKSNQNFGGMNES
ncbi:MAG: copper-binding protein [Acidobacteria bacterium]|nr:copper-binding protein [Acidobacteriota bacterium]